MPGREDIARLLKEAAASMKRDVRGAIDKLQSAYAIAVACGDDDDTSVVAEELARGWGRKRSFSKSLYFATHATELAPDQRATWTTLGKTCELVATRTLAENKRRRQQALYRATASAFRKAAALTKDPEDKRWLQELASDAARQAKGES